MSNILQHFGGVRQGLAEKKNEPRTIKGTGFKAAGAGLAGYLGGGIGASAGGVYVINKIDKANPGLLKTLANTPNLPKETLNNVVRSAIKRMPDADKAKMAGAVLGGAAVGAGTFGYGGYQAGKALHNVTGRKRGMNEQRLNESPLGLGLNAANSFMGLTALPRVYGATLGGAFAGADKMSGGRLRDAAKKVAQQAPEMTNKVRGLWNKYKEAGDLARASGLKESAYTQYGALRYMMGKQPFGDPAHPEKIGKALKAVASPRTSIKSAPHSFGYGELWRRTFDPASPSNKLGTMEPEYAKIVADMFPRYGK